MFAYNMANKSSLLLSLFTGVRGTSSGSSTSRDRFIAAVSLPSDFSGTTNSSIVRASFPPGYTTAKALMSAIPISFLHVCSVSSTGSDLGIVDDKMWNCFNVSCAKPRCNSQVGLDARRTNAYSIKGGYTVVVLVCAAIWTARLVN